MKIIKHKKIVKLRAYILRYSFVLVLLASLLVSSSPASQPVQAAPTRTVVADVQGYPPVNTPYFCGDKDHRVAVSINIGCKGLGNPILDGLFAIIRFLSAGAGLVMIASLVVAGIQYTSSRGDPGATANAINRIRNTFIALLLFIFTYAILNWVVPGTILK